MTGIDPSPFLISPVLSSLSTPTLSGHSLPFPFHPFGLPGNPSMSNPRDIDAFGVCSLARRSLRWHSLFSVPSKVSIALYTLGALTPLYPMHCSILTHTLCSLCHRSAHCQHRDSPPVPPFARVPRSDLFAILSLVSGPLPFGSESPTYPAVLASSRSHANPAAPAPPRRCRSIVRCTSPATEGTALTDPPAHVRATVASATGTS